MSERPIETKANNEKVIRIISYFTFFGWIIAYLLHNPKSENGSFHLRQSLGINILFIVSGIVMIVPILGWIAGIAGYLLGALLWLLGLIYAIDGDSKTVPVVGKYFQEWFQGI